jgi:signal transduction histidine kinase
MRSLYLRIWLTVVLALALFGAVSGWLVQRALEQQRAVAEAAARERLEAWADLLQRSLPPADAPRELQADALREWSQRLRLPLALDDAQGARIASSENFARRESEIPGYAERAHSIRLDDGRTLRVARLGPRGPGMGPRGGMAGAMPGRMPGAMPGAMPGDLRDGPGGVPGDGIAGGSRPPTVAALPAPEGLPRTLLPAWAPGWLPRGVPDGVGLAALLIVLFVAVAGGAYPVVRRLTRRLEALKQGVEAFGGGALGRRVAEDGKDEVAALAASFNQAAARIESLVRSHQSLLANASHELRSPLARLKMALAMLDDAPAAERPRLRHEIETNLAELDALVEEVLLSSRLDARSELEQRAPVDLLGVAAEEAARIDAAAGGEPLRVPGDERLVRRALRNLLENARRYGGGQVEVQVHRRADRAEVRVDDNGPGVPEGYRERIFEAFFRLPGHAERAGGVGLGLALVRQIAERHGGSVRCEPREGGGSRFVLALPLA